MPGALPFEILPKVYVLRDKDGKLQTMPGIGFEEFIEAWKARNQVGVQARRPGYSLEKLTLAGTAARERADLAARFSITLLEAGWVGVPLRLGDAVLREPQFEGSGEHVLRYDPQAEGYTVWIKSEAGSKHVATLQLLARVVQTGPESRLRLNVPRAAVSQLQLQVPLERAVAQISEGSTLESVRAIEGGRTQFNAVGVGGEFELSWHSADVPVASLPSVLEATGLLFVRVNGRSVNTDVKLTVRSLSGEFDRCEIRLPPGADYVGTAPAGMTLVALDTDAARGKLYEVRFDRKTSGPVEIPLVTERIHNSPQNDELLELAGFEVVGAVRQSGTVAVKIEGNWQVVWGESNHVAQVDELSDLPRRDEATAGFEYFAQPYSLTARILPQRTRVKVQGDYVVHVGSEGAQLEAKLSYTIRGAKVRSLEVELPGWQIDAVGPSELVDVNAEVTAKDETYTIPLREATSGELQVTLQAHRTTDRGETGVEFQLPRPKAETVAPANVAIVPADNIELEFAAEKSASLAPQTSPPALELPQRSQDPLFFRTESSPARFAGTIKVHEQAIVVASSTQLEVEEAEIRVDSRLGFRIAYEPAESLLLSVPRAIRLERLAVTLDGQRLATAAVRERPGESGDAVGLRVALPAPQIGRCDLQIRYTVRNEQPTDGGGRQVVVPLVMPGEGQITTNELSITPGAGISVKYPAGPWNEEPHEASAAPIEILSLSARRALGQVALQLSYKERPATEATTIRRAWIQARLTDSVRADRAVFRLITHEPRLLVTLPPGADMRQFEVRLDARSVTPDTVRQRELGIQIPGPPGGEHSLELRYHFPQRPPLGAIHLEAPTILSAGWVQQAYWQLLLPAHEHVLIAPSGLTREYRWAWSALFWQREPTWNDRDLEQWCDVPPADEPQRADQPVAGRAAPRPDAESSAANRYLYGSLGVAEPLRVYTLSRARLVLWASLPLLLTGLALIHFPRLRHPALFLALGLATAAGCLIDPELSLVLAQASSLGVLLAVFAVLLARTPPRTTSTTVPVRGSSQSLVERAATEIFPRPVAPSPPSTATDPLLSAAAPEGEP